MSANQDFGGRAKFTAMLPGFCTIIVEIPVEKNSYFLGGAVFFYSAIIVFIFFLILGGNYIIM